jgi:hypothetical protein
MPFNTKLVDPFLWSRASEHRRREKLRTPRMTIPDISVLVMAFSWKGGALREPARNDRCSRKASYHIYHIYHLPPVDAANTPNTSVK